MARSKSRLNLRDSQLQARLGVVFAAGGGGCVLLLAFFILDNFNLAEKTIAYSPETLRYPAILAFTGLSLVFGAVGFGLGISSLGHKRNARQRESWLGFLIGALVISLTIVLFVMFRMFRLPIIT